MPRRVWVAACLALAVLAPFRPASAAQPPKVTLGCNDEVTRSIRLAADVGYPGGCSLTGLRVTRDGVTLDLNGHTIWGNRTDNDAGLVESGVVVGGRRDVRVVNGTVRGFEVGLLSSGAPKLVVRSVTFADHSDTGMVVAGRGARVEKNVATAIVGTGMAIFSDLGVVDGNTVTDTGGPGIAIIGVGSSVTRNTVAAGGDHGIDLNGSRSTITGNVVASNDGNGIDFIGSGTVGGNRSISNGGHGIFVSNTDPLRVVGNKALHNSGEGIFVDGDDVKIADNVASANDQDGIEVVGNDTILRRNRADGNTGSGLESEGLRAAIDDNRVTGNVSSGIRVDGGTATAGGNRTIGNGFDGTPNATGAGIDATGAVISVSGKNIARANDDATCNPVGACADEHTDLPEDSPGCGDVITESFRMSESIGDSLSRCSGHGLIVAGDNITVDLGGFAIWGSATDNGGEAEAGILLTGKGSRVFGGRIAGFEVGVRAEKGTVSDVVVTGAQRTGMFSFPGAKLKTVAAVENDGDGFLANGGLSSGVSHANTGRGVSAGGMGPGRVKDTVAFDNGEEGVVVAGEDGSVKGTVAVRNGEIGIETRGNKSRTVKSISFGNGTTGLFSGTVASGARSVVRSTFSGGNSGVGIAITGKDSVVEKNASVDDDNSGIALGTPATGSAVTSNIAIGAVQFHGILANGAKSVLRSNRVLANDSSGIQVGVHGVQVIGNRVIGNPVVGIVTAAVRVKIDGNRATANGFGAVGETGLGIDASDALTVSGNNVAYGNDDPDGCDPASLC